MTLSDKNSFKKCFLTQGVSPEIFEKAVSLLPPPQDFKKGETVYDPSHFKKALGVVLSGTVTIMGGENEKILLRNMSEGDTFGAAAVFSEDEFYVSRIVSKTDCRIQFIEQELLQTILFLDNTLALNYIKFLSAKTRYLNTKIGSFTCQSSDEKLLYYMSAHSEGGRVCLPRSMTVLASTLGIGRSSLYRSFESLTKSGAIKKINNDWMVVKNEN